MDELRNNVDYQDKCNEENRIETNKDCNKTNSKDYCSFCENIKIDSNIPNLMVMPILSKRIFDFVCLKDEQFKYDPCVRFYIEDDNYCDGDQICIDHVYAEYDFIGLRDKVLDGKMDSQNLKFHATNDSLYVCSINCGCSSENDEVYLYDEYIANIKEVQIDNNPNNHKVSIKSRIFEENLTFYICNLKIIASGKIGGKYFRASTKPYTGELSNCSKDYEWGPGFKPVDFYSRVDIPRVGKKVSIFEEFKGYLTIDCINTYDTYKKDNELLASFDASIEYSLLINKKIYTVIKEKLSVLTINQNIICCPENSEMLKSPSYCSLNGINRSDLNI